MAGAKRITFTLGPAKFEKSYVFFPLLEGGIQANRLHDLLYSGDLGGFKSLEHEYEPHVTFGRYQNETDLDSILLRAKDGRCLSFS